MNGHGQNYGQTCLKGSPTGNTKIGCLKVGSCPNDDKSVKFFHLSFSV